VANYSTDEIYGLSNDNKELKRDRLITNIMTTNHIISEDKLLDILDNQDDYQQVTESNNDVCWIDVDSMLFGLSLDCFFYSWEPGGGEPDVSS
jgi:hypothetical protein